MKKYLLTALLWVFAFVGFVSADTVWNYSSDDEISTLTVSNSSYTIGLYDYLTSDYWYFCISSSDFPYYIGIDWVISTPIYVNSSSYCSSSLVYADTDLFFYSDSSLQDSKNIDWTVYISSSEITYSSSSGGWDSGDSPLLSGWTTAFSGIISSLGSAVSEFIPYVAYIWIWLLGAIIWFVAIKRLINRIRAKIFWTFNSRRRK